MADQPFVPGALACPYFLGDLGAAISKPLEYGPDYHADFFGTITPARLV
jgi:hypothetical protein